MSTDIVGENLRLGNYIYTKEEIPRRRSRSRTDMEVGWGRGKSSEVEGGVHNNNTELLYGRLLNHMWRSTRQVPADFSVGKRWDSVEVLRSTTDDCYTEMPCGCCAR